MSLTEGQYQIGNLVFGRNTPYPISSLDPGGYQSTVGDYQMAEADEIRMTRDFLQPGGMVFTLGVLDNKVLPAMAFAGVADMSKIIPGRRLLDDLSREWRADAERLTWGVLKPLLCHKEGLTHRVYGRPGKFTASAKSLKSQEYTVTMEYRRADTLSYSDTEYVLDLPPTTAGATNGTIERGVGQAPCWLRIVLTGPINQPKIKIGSLFTIDLSSVVSGYAMNLAAGKFIEINSYPWSRRLIDSDGFNRNPCLVSGSPYLSQIRLPAGSSTPIGFSGSATTGATHMQVFWREAYNIF